jgi:hypothetical protein
MTNPGRRVINNNHSHFDQDVNRPHWPEEPVLDCAARFPAAPVHGGASPEYGLFPNLWYTGSALDVCRLTVYSATVLSGAVCLPHPPGPLLPQGEGGESIVLLTFGGEAAENEPS